MPSRSSVQATLPDTSDAGDIACLAREAWAAALEHRDFTDDDDFFVVGGSSLLAARVMARLSKDLGQRLRMRMFFINPTVNDLAAAVAAETAAQPREDRA